MVARSIGPLIVIVGPTASGKSALGLDLAEQFQGEIVCADSRTVYSDMNIGTAKPSTADQARVPHHLISVVRPDEPFTVADFKTQAEVAISDILARGHVPFLVGGSGLYIDAVLYDYQFSADAADRDPINPRHRVEGGSIDKTIRDNTLVLGLDATKEQLEERIRSRITEMIDQGLVAEAEKLATKYGWDIESMKTYRPLRSLIEGHDLVEEVVAKMVIKDRQLAKKQRTWFTRNKSIHWIAPSQAHKLVKKFLS